VQAGVETSALVDSKAPGPGAAMVAIRRRATRKIAGSGSAPSTPAVTISAPATPHVLASAPPPPSDVALQPVGSSKASVHTPSDTEALAGAGNEGASPEVSTDVSRAAGEVLGAVQVLREASPSHASASTTMIEKRDASAFWSKAAFKFQTVMHQPQSATASAPQSPLSRTPKKRPAPDEEDARANLDVDVERSRRRVRDPASPLLRTSAEVSQDMQIEDRAPGTLLGVSEEVDAKHGTERETKEDRKGEEEQVQSEEVAEEKDAEMEPGELSPTRFPVTAGSPSASPQAMVLNSHSEVCEICCNDIPSFRAVRLGCRHGWYCAQCVLKHAEARLAVGATSIPCPECCTPIAERNLRKMLPPEIIERLLARSIDQAVASAADLWSCPTPNCTMRVALAENQIPRLKCTLCGKTSCLRCQAQPYHTGRTCEQHIQRLQSRGGKTRLQQAMEAEAKTMKWIEETGTRQCPTCRMGVTKQDLGKQNTQKAECHKMLCRNCNTRFCFKCLTVLTDTFTCGCSNDLHGFVDPKSGKRLDHFKPLRGQGKANAKRRARG
jgi:hypothetical protein